MVVGTISKHEKVLLVGDNPFHNVSHLSQDRARLRDQELSNPEHAAELVRISCDNGANGFMFSVSDTTLAILKSLRNNGRIDDLALYPIVPYAYEYVQLATQVGGIAGLAGVFSKRLAYSGNLGTIASGINGVLRANPVSLLKTYLTYELGRIRSSAGKKARMHSVILHEVVVDMALALGMDWFFRAHVDFTRKHGYVAGFNTCNFAYLINKFRNWKIRLDDIVVAAPFNKVGFEMNPSREDCEKALKSLDEPVLIPISIMAAGYLKLEDAANYIGDLPNIRGVVAGVSKEKHAQETFKLLKKKLG
jgi:hypothetical protein